MDISKFLNISPDELFGTISELLHDDKIYLFDETEREEAEQRLREIIARSKEKAEQKAEDVKKKTQTDESRKTKADGTYSIPLIHFPKVSTTPNLDKIVDELDKVTKEAKKETPTPATVDRNIYSNEDDFYVSLNPDVSSLVDNFVSKKDFLSQNNNFIFTQSEVQHEVNCVVKQILTDIQDQLTMPFSEEDNKILARVEVIKYNCMTNSNDTTDIAKLRKKAFNDLVYKAANRMIVNILNQKGYTCDIYVETSKLPVKAQNKEYNLFDNETIIYEVS